MKSYTIKEPDHGIRLNRFLARVVPALPASLMYKALRKKDIRVNGARCEASTRLNTGDTLTLYIDDRFFADTPAPAAAASSDAPLTVLYEDSNIAVLYKPRGLLCHSTVDGSEDTLVGRFLRYLAVNGEYAPDADTAFRPALCNRLDRNTEGLVVAAKNTEALRAVQRLIRADRLEKRYLCAVSGVAPKDGTYTAYLHKDENANTVTVSGKPLPQYKEIVTALRTVARTGDLTLFSVGLITGRTHQIRAHLAFLGTPVLGDEKYGDRAVNRRYRLHSQALCANALIFHPDKMEDPLLYYLNGVSVAVPDVDFVRKLFPTYKL